MLAFQRIPVLYVTRENSFKSSLRYETMATLEYSKGKEK